MLPLLLQLACHPGPKTETGETDDSAPVDTSTEPAWQGLDPSLLAPPKGSAVADAFSVDPTLQVEWQRDASFRLEGLSVPQVHLRSDGAWIMLATFMPDPIGRMMLMSYDGLDWVTTLIGPFTPSWFDNLDCGGRFSDSAVLYESSGLMRLVLTGVDLVSNGKPMPRRWCQATSSDGWEWTPQDSYFWPGSEPDGGESSVPAFLPLADGSHILTYNVIAKDKGSGIRTAWVTGDPPEVVEVSAERVLDGTDVDPSPAWSEGGGLILFHTHGLGGGPGSALTTDGVHFTDDTGLVAHEGSCEPGDPDANGDCLLDPVYMRLADGTMVLYYTQMTLDQGMASFAIGRAMAVESGG